MGLCETKAKHKQPQKVHPINSKIEKKKKPQFKIEIEEASQKSIVVKNVADNPDKYLLRKDPRKCFKNYVYDDEPLNQKLSTKDSRIKIRTPSNSNNIENNEK